MNSDSLKRSLGYCKALSGYFALLPRSTLPPQSALPLPSARPPHSALHAIVTNRPGYMIRSTR